jgi:hypothetical protein
MWITGRGCLPLASAQSSISISYLQQELCMICMHQWRSAITSRVCCQGIAWAACHTVCLTFQGSLALIIFHHEQPGRCICVDLSAVRQQPGSQRRLTHELNTPCGVVPTGQADSSSSSNSSGSSSSNSSGSGSGSRQAQVLNTPWAVVPAGQTNGSRSRSNSSSSSSPAVRGGSLKIPWRTPGDGVPPRAGDTFGDTPFRIENTTACAASKLVC